MALLLPIFAIPSIVAPIAEIDLPTAGICGSIGVRVRPMTPAFGRALGMVELYGGIFDQPEPGSAAALAGIEQGDVVTAIEGVPLRKANDFAATVSRFAPGLLINLTVYRNGALRPVRVSVQSASCPNDQTVLDQ